MLNYLIDNAIINMNNNMNTILNIITYYNLNFPILSLSSFLCWVCIYGLCKQIGTTSIGSTDILSMTFFTVWYSILTVRFYRITYISYEMWEMMQSIPIGYSMFWIFIYFAKRNMFASSITLSIHIIYIISYILYYNNYPTTFSLIYISTEIGLRIPLIINAISRFLFKQPGDPQLYLFSDEENELNHHDKEN